LSGDFLGDERAKVVQRAYDSLVATVEQMRRALKLSREADPILKEIKKTLHTQVREQIGKFVWMETEGPTQVNPGGLTALQVLCERERATAFNQTEGEPPSYFVNAIQDSVIALDGKTPTRKVRNTARNAWKDDPRADRRIRERDRIQEREPFSPNDTFRSPYRGRPETYPADVVWAFANAITRAAGREQFSVGHHGDAAVIDENKGGPMLRVLVAAVRWGMMTAWLASAPEGSSPPVVRPEGILSLIKRGR
jgi:hypothetical protein